MFQFVRQMVRFQLYNAISIQDTVGALIKMASKKLAPGHRMRNHYVIVRYLFGQFCIHHFHSSSFPCPLKIARSYETFTAESLQRASVFVINLGDLVNNH